MWTDIVSELWEIKQANSSEQAQSSWMSDLPLDLRHYLDNLEEDVPISPGRLVMLRDYLFVSLFDGVYRGKTSDLRDKYYRMLVDLTIAKSMSRLLRKHLVSGMLRKICRFGQKYGFADLTGESAELLAIHYANDPKHFKLSKEYLDIAEDANDVVRRAIRAKWAFVQLKRRYIQGGHEAMLSPDLLRLSEECWNEVKPFLWITPSYRFHVDALLTGYLYHELRGDLLEAINIANQGVAHFHVQGWNYPQVIYNFYMNMAQAGLKLGRDDQVMKWIHIVKEELSINSSKWYSVIYIEILILLKQKKYQNAFELFYSNYQRTFYKRISQLHLRRWSLMRLYLDYLIDVGVVQAESRMQRRNFKADYSDIPDFSKEKQSRNVAVIVIQLLHHIRRREYDLLAIRFTALKRYSTKYLRKDGNYRSGCFIKMLLEIPKQGFHQEAIRRHAAKYIRRLEAQSHRVSMSSQELEIIPYPDLWEIALSSIKKRPQRASKTLRELREI